MATITFWGHILHCRSPLRWTIAACLAMSILMAATLVVFICFNDHDKFHEEVHSRQKQTLPRLEKPNSDCPTFLVCPNSAMGQYRCHLNNQCDQSQICCLEYNVMGSCCISRPGPVGPTQTTEAGTAAPSNATGPFGNGTEGPETNMTGNGTETTSSVGNGTVTGNGTAPGNGTDLGPVGVNGTNVGPVAGNGTEVAFTTPVPGNGTGNGAAAAP